MRGQQMQMYKPQETSMVRIIPNNNLLHQIWETENGHSHAQTQRQ
jgi:hypothetical protein